MLRLISLPRLPRLHPHSSFATTATKSSSRKRKKRKSSSSKPEWQGLSQYRLQTLRRHTRYTFQPQPSLSNATLDTMLISALRAHPMHIVSPLITHAASLAPKNYQPSEQALVTILSSIVSAASDHHLRFSPADISTESFFRITHAFNVRPTLQLQLLEAVVKHAATDPIVERRSQRVWSVFRTMRSLQLAPTSDLIFRCFQTCVSALDVPAAVTLMEYALSNGMYNDHLQPRIIDYYNSVMYAAFLRDQYPVITAVREELHRNNVPTDTFTEALLLATYIETSDPRAHQLHLQLKPPLPDVVHAAIIRAAARLKNTSAVIEAFHKFEEDLQHSARPFRDTLSQPAVTTLPAYGSLSEITLATVRGDPTMSTFHALRACGAPDEALALMVRLKERYGFQPSRLVYSTIIETAWRSGKLALAQKLRVDMQAGAAVGYTAPEERNAGADFV